MKIRRFLILIPACFLAIATVCAQESAGDRYSIPLSDPARPAKLEVSVLNGSITVRASEGKEVVVEARRSSGEPDSDRRRGGLRLIPNTSAGLTIEEEDNTVSVSTGHRGMSSTVDLMIMVPTKTSVKLSSVNDGDILIEGLEGEHEVNNVNGGVTLKNIAGSAVAHALNEDLIATFTSVTPGKAMSFSSLNGTIDVTFPATTKATLNLKSDQGEIYTDFDVSMEKTSPKVEKEKRGGRRRVVVEKGMRGTINGGGAEFVFKNFTGDIVIRKGK